VDLKQILWGLVEDAMAKQQAYDGAASCGVSTENLEQIQKDSIEFCDKRIDGIIDYINRDAEIQEIKRIAIEKNVYNVE
jgi:hypothetical protein